MGYHRDVYYWGKAGYGDYDGQVYDEWEGSEYDDDTYDDDSYYGQGDEEEWGESDYDIYIVTHVTVTQMMVRMITRRLGQNIMMIPVVVTQMINQMFIRSGRVQSMIVTLMIVTHVIVVVKQSSTFTMLCIYS